MGAQSFAINVKAKTPEKGYNVLVEEALYEHGHNPYNGTISTCKLGKCTLKLDGYHEENINKAWNHIQEMDYGKKWVADYIDFGADYEGNHSYTFYGWASC